MTRRQKHTTIDGPFVARTRAMLESPAYRVLSLSGHRVLARVEIEHLSHAGQENGRLPVTFNNFVDFGIDPHSVVPAIRECVALRFLEISRVGRAGNGEFRQATLYRLTYIHTYRPDVRATNEWQFVRTPEQAEELAKAARAPHKRAPVRQLWVVG
jgi:hypothetical protein